MYSELRNWIKTYARPLEKARFAYLFEQGERLACQKELQKFQNFDGGFGHGLEADCTNPDSAPIQSHFAAEIILELQLDKQDPMVKRLCDYFSHTINKDGFWQTTIPSNNDYPRAPWWTYKEEESIWGYNPTAAILGFLYRYDDAPRWKSHIEKAISDFLNIQKHEMHEVKCFLDLYEDIKPNKEDFSDFVKFQNRLKEVILSMVERDSSKWLTSYVPRPIQLCNHRGDLASTVIEDLVIQELLLLKEEFLKNGIWPITWQWGQYEEEFQKAVKAWQGVFALQIARMWKEYHLM